MSSSSSSSSDGEETAPVKDHKTKSATSKQSSSSDSDFVERKKETKTAKDKPKHLVHQSTPLQNNALASSKLMFQKMLMGSNNKLAELLKNKQNAAEKNKDVSPSPIKGILKRSKSKNNETDIDFDPIASSTQIKEVTMSETPSEKIKKIKHKKKEYVSETESLSSEKVSKKHAKKKHHKQILQENANITSKQQKVAQNSISQDSSDSDNNTIIEKIKSKKDSNKLKTVQKDSSSSSSSSDESSNNKKRESSGNESEDERSKSKSKSYTTNRSRNDSLASTSNLDSSSNKKLKKSKKHKQKSSSESESEDETNLSAPSKFTSQFKKFESYHKGIMRINDQHNLLDNIKSSEEIFLVQIPKKLDPNSLVGTKISLTETVRVPTGSRKYDCIPSQKPQKDPVAIFTNTEKVHLMKSAGNIKIQKHIKSKRIPDLSDMWNNQVTSFPENLKQRHPLFGADYSDKVNLEEHIQQKLKAAVESYTKQKKKKKKHNKKKEADVSHGEQEEEIFKFLNQTDSSAKHVKSSKEKESEKSSEELEGKHKKKKKKKEKTESLESEEQMEEFPVKKKKVKKHKKHSYDEELDETKKGNSEDALQLINEMLLSKSVEMSTTKEKKKRKHSMVEDDNPETSRSSDLEIKKKKHKKEHKTL